MAVLDPSGALLDRLHVPVQHFAHQLRRDRLQSSATVPMIDIQAYAAWLTR